MFFFFQAEDGIRDRDGWLEFRRVLFRSSTHLTTHPHKDKKNTQQRSLICYTFKWQVSSQSQVNYPSGVVVKVFSDCYTLKCRKASKSSEQSVGAKNIHETPYIQACQQETSLCLINKVRQIMNKGQLLLITASNKHHAYLVCLWIMISNSNRLWKTWGKLLTGNSTQLPCSISSQATILVALPCIHVCD